MVSFNFRTHLELSDIILDFQSTNFEKDRVLLTNLLMDYVKKCKLLELKDNNEKVEVGNKDAKSNRDSKAEKSKDSDPESTSSIFRITPSYEIAGWSFAKLIISNKFLFEILKEVTTSSKVSESELKQDKLFKLVSKYRSRGKQYRTSNYKIIMFIVWINDKLKKLGSDSFVKIGEDMGESSRPGGLPTGAGFTAAGVGGGHC